MKKKKNKQANKQKQQQISVDTTGTSSTKDVKQWNEAHICSSCEINQERWKNSNYFGSTIKVKKHYDTGLEI